MRWQTTRQSQFNFITSMCFDCRCSACHSVGWKGRIKASHYDGYLDRNLAHHVSFDSFQFTFSLDRCSQIKNTFFKWNCNKGHNGNRTTLCFLFSYPFLHLRCPFAWYRWIHRHAVGLTPVCSLRKQYKFLVNYFVFLPRICSQNVSKNVAVAVVYATAIVITPVTPLPSLLTTIEMRREEMNGKGML